MYAVHLRVSFPLDGDDHVAGLDLRFPSLLGLGVWLQNVHVLGAFLRLHMRLDDLMGLLRQGFSALW